MSGSHLSKDFFELIKSIGECKSKQEEDKILTNEVAVLKQRFTETLSPKRMKEAIVRMMYAEMLGHDASFGYIHAVNMTQQVNLLSKRVGYLASAVCLHSGHELTTLLVNTMRRDLKSSNHVEVCATLIAIPKLINVETLPALTPPVVSLLEHPHEVVRKKAVMVLHRLYQLQPSCAVELSEKLRRVLCDKDPAVMGASLHILHDASENDPMMQKDLVPSFVSILKQITEHRLPSSFDYHRMPAPWIQIKLLKVLSTLGASDQRASEGMYEVLYDVLRRADTGINIGFAIIYECVRTITTIYPNIQLLETAANHISRFVSSDNHNLKYLGIKALASIVQVDQKYALEHQMLVVECMEDPDETLKRKTLELLFRMTNSSNVVFVVDKLLSHLTSATDVQFRAGLTEKITQLAERYAPDNSWFISTMNAVFELGGELVRPDVAHNLMRLIAEGSGEDEDADMALRSFAAQTYFDMLSKPKLPDILMQVVCWVLGEYAYLSIKPLNRALERLCDAVERQFTHASTRCWVVVAMTKLVAQLGELPEQVAEIAAKYQNASDVLLSKYCHELEALALDMPSMRVALPVDASCEDLEVDPQLRFLDLFVAQAIASGAQPYLPPGERPDELDVGSRERGSLGHTLRFDEYQRPQEPQRNMLTTAGGMGPALAVGSDASSTDTGCASNGGLGSSGGLNTAGVAKKWGAHGFNAVGKTETPTSTPAAPSMQVPSVLSQSAVVSHGVSSPLPAASQTQQREPTEKEKMAAALFGGIAGNSSAAKVAQAPPAPAVVLPAQSVAAVAMPPGPPPKEKKKKKKMEGGVAAPTASPPVAPQADLLGDLLELAPAPPGAPPVAVTPSAPPPGVSDDLLSLLDAPAAMPGAVVEPMLGAMPAAVLPQTEVPPPGSSELSNDEKLSIRCAVKIQPSTTDLELTLSSITSAGLRNVVLQIEPPPSLAMSLTAPPIADVRGPRLTLANLSFGTSCTVCASITARSAAAGAEQNLLGQLSYFQSHNPEARVVSFKMPLSASDMMRPYKIATSQFGQLWHVHAAEKKTVAYATLASSPSSYTSFLESQMHLAPVDTIGMECISCGVLVGSEQAILVHSKLGLMGGRGLELTVRSREIRLTDVVHRQLLDALSNQKSLPGVVP
mmetsp:Transcript_23595/g.38929  ORF Transcript_23595/g.38929 Transcript_23595/m.38929 type:complete len:1140 (-) Transcript_23595:210-3629(-)